MEPRQTGAYNCPLTGEWQWLYNQPTICLRRQRDLLARLMIAEVADMDKLQALILRWGTFVNMREHVEWMSINWVKSILKDLDKERGCLGKRMDSFDRIETEVST